MKAIFYIFTAFLLASICNPSQKLYAMNEQENNDNALQKLIEDSSEEKKRKKPLVWCIKVDEVSDIENQLKAPSIKSKKKRKKSTNDGTIKYNLAQAEEKNDIFLTMNLMNTIQSGQNKETRELLKLFSGDMADQVEKILTNITTNYTDTVKAITDQNDKLQKELARNSAKNALKLGCLSVTGAIVTTLITISYNSQ